MYSLNHLDRPVLSAAFALVAAALPAPAQAQGDLLVAPTRVIINGSGSSEVILSNIGAAPATYRINLELRRMDAEGNLTDIAEADANLDERAALAMLRYAPHRITLQPNQPQAIRISARPPAELADGEYRVHMAFRAIPEIKPVDEAEATQAAGLTIRLTPIYGITIPLIVRKGQLEGSATIADPQLVRDGANTSLRLAMTRTGNRSIYGEIKVTARGGGEPIFLARGLAIYRELASRTLQLPLSPEQVARMKGPVHIEYREMAESGGKLISAVDATF